MGANEVFRRLHSKTSAPHLLRRGQRKRGFPAWRPGRRACCWLMATLLWTGAASVHGASPQREATGSTATMAPTRIANIRAFAKLYGYVRYFHPADAARQIDWNRFAIHGVESVQWAASRNELKTQLESLFSPIAPTVQIYLAEDSPPKPDAILTPEDTTGLQPVFWQHFGVGLGQREWEDPIYRSVRVNGTPTGKQGQAARNPLDKAPEPIFEARPTPGEVADRSLGRGLRAQIPLLLFSRDGKTLRPDNAPPLSHLQSELNKIDLDSMGAADETLRYADIVIAWNILQHFHPYIDVVDTNWSNEVFVRALRQAWKDQGVQDFRYTLLWMVAQLGDSHGSVYNLEYFRTHTPFGLPFRVRKIEGKAVITAVENKTSGACAQVGDILLFVDGIPPLQNLRWLTPYIPGSSQHKEFIGMRNIGTGPAGSVAHVKLKRSGDVVGCNVKRVENFVPEPRPAAFTEIVPNVYYLDIDRVPWDEEQHEMIQKLAAAEGIIFDLRGYPVNFNYMTEMLGHLTRQRLLASHTMVPQAIYPDRQNVTFHDYRRPIVPRTPYFDGQIVFLSNARAISLAEYFLEVVKAHNLGEIVGQPTAGINGNIQISPLPGGYEMVWTGMRVVEPDGSVHYRTGIQPDVPVERTLAGVRAGADIYIETALGLISNQQRGSARNNQRTEGVSSNPLPVDDPAPADPFQQLYQAAREESLHSADPSPSERSVPAPVTAVLYGHTLPDGRVATRCRIEHTAGAYAPVTPPIRLPRERR